MKWIVALCLLIFPCSAYASAAGDWTEVYRALRDSYISEVKVSALSVAALRGISQVDPYLRLGDDDTRLSLYYRGKVVKVKNKPKELESPEQWGEITAQILEAARQASATADEKDFLLDEALARSMTKLLDKDSKYYAGYDEAEGLEHRNHRTFAARMRRDDLYVRIIAFNKQTYHNLTEALKEYAAARKLILDLRGCAGGQASSAIQTADLFLNEGIIASSVGREHWKQTYYTADAAEVWTGKDIEIWVDGQTASAAEILTAALKEQGRAVVKGEKTFGKGTLQKLIPLPSGGVLALTSGVVQTPSGGVFNAQGITPDFPLDEEDLAED
ncbi:MAG: hypothetical protein IJ184_02875 [Alphaproteobacteria bacterium]|nr:hypothetical protein [Alphaproteobacteria bacterium]